MPLIVTLLACGAAETPAPAPSPAPVPAAAPTGPPPAGRLLYVSEAGGLPRASIVGADGAGARELTGVPGASFPADPDPQGTHALLVTSEEAPGDAHRETLWLAPLAGGEPVKVAGPGATVRSPAWAADGSLLVYESDANSFRDLYVVAREGGEGRRLTEAPNGSFEPAVSPDRTRVAFGTSRDGNAEIYVADLQTGAAARLTEDPADDVRPRWSPDGLVVSWIASRGGSARVWRAAPDGTGARPVRPATGVDLDQVWSPQGDRLAIVVQGGPSEVRIEIVDPAKGDVLATIDGPGVDEQPAWSPDGGWIAFTSGRGGNPDVWLARADGTDARALTSDPAPEWLPRWISPAP